MDKNATLYIKNLNEKIKIPTLIEDLKEIFGEFGNIIDVVAKKSLHRRGQAFIVYESADEAAEALETLNGFELHGKELEAAFAKTRSDATVKKDDSEEVFEAHRRHRLAEKERKQALEAETAAKRPAPEAMAERPAKSAKSNAAAALMDEYLPPNKILIIREFPQDYGEVELSAIFRRYEGFKEVRIPPIPNLAFVEYEDETGAIAAREAMNGAKLGDGNMKVTYQKQ